MSEIRIFLADAAFLVRRGLQSVIAAYPYMHVVGEAGQSEELRSGMARVRADLFIIDYHAPGAFSIDDVRYISEQAPASHILVISSDLEREQVFRALEYGVRGFLLKECDQTEILGAIHALSKREKFFCGRVLDLVLERKVRHSLGDACEPARLTERETEIVALMAAGVSTQDIAERLSLSVHTIYTHRKNVMRKLGVTTAAEVILYAINTSLTPTPRA
ncbi:MAG: response regulator transcription factor [Bacteroidia bacterium]